jgi:F-type H+-transporting ATPase subunit epsilon
MNKFMLSITASSGEFYQGDCEDLTLPISDGIYGVQAGHNPVLVALHMGILHFVVDGKARDVLVGDGIAEVTPAYVMVLVDSAENRAEAARIRAEERLQHKQSMHEYYQSKIALDRAMQRLQTAAKYKR